MYPYIRTGTLLSLSIHFNPGKHCASPSQSASHLPNLLIEPPLLPASLNVGFHRTEEPLVT